MNRESSDTKKMENQLSEMRKILNFCDRLDIDDDPLQIEELKGGFDKLYQPTISFKDISDLITMCLYYEDLYHKRESVLSKTLINNAINDLTRRIEKYSIFSEYFTIEKNRITDEESFINFITELHESISELEEQL